MAGGGVSRLYPGGGGRDPVGVSGAAVGNGCEGVCFARGVGLLSAECREGWGWAKDKDEEGETERSMALLLSKKEGVGGAEC